MHNVFVFITIAGLLIVNQTGAAGNNSIMEDVFSLSNENVENHSIHQTFESVTGKDELRGFSITLQDRKSMFGASITADINLHGKASLVRIVLIDSKDNEWLIYEVYSLIAKEPTFLITNVCDETKLLTGISPSRLRIELVHASIRLHEMHIARTAPCKRGEIGTYQTMIKQEQLKQKIHLLNTFIQQKGMTWTAGVTSISSYTYAEKKILFYMDGMMANLQGFEYYTGGIFEHKSNIPDESVAPTSTIIDAFDWRSRHGATNPKSPYYDKDTKGTGWDTFIKNQSSPKKCGSCWAHSTLASAETMINLFYNQHIDMDLSEQYLMECSNACSKGKGCNGGSPTKASKWVVKYGNMEEKAFPYTATNDPDCGDSVETPMENLRFKGVVSVSGKSVSEDSLKKFLIKYGPLNVGVRSMSHAMSLVGFGKDDRTKATVWIFKNSHGLKSGKNGYLSIKKEKSDFGMAGYTLPITSKIYSTKDIKCLDLDKDGYYNWGIGPKPAQCPECPDEVDCDDSRADLGPWEEDGSCKKITTEMTLKTFPKSDIVFNFNPNPFNRFTTIRFQTSDIARSTVQIHDVSGSLIRSFTFDQTTRGVHEVLWDGTNQRGDLISNGMYLCTIKINHNNNKIIKSMKLFVSR